MELKPFKIKSKCVMEPDQLFGHIESALARNLPVIGQHFEHDGVAVMVGSGPTVQDELDSIRKQRALGHPIIALKDAHDWLIDNGIVPDYAAAIDPQENQWKCFQKPHKDVKYFIASQCHPSLFDHLNGCQVFLWHLYIQKGQTIPPPGTPLIAGGTTTGLRTISLFYSMGYRQFELYGYDSCLKNGVLRRSGWQPTTESEAINEIVVDGRVFQCNPPMTSQANEFQNLYVVMPDIEIESHGDGLITAIIEARKKQGKSRISFIHHGGPNVASYRYRAAIPAGEFGASINDLSADVVIFAKPMPADVDSAKSIKERGGKVIVDFCDDHFEWPYYIEMMQIADEVICPTEEMAKRIKELGRDAHVIDDPFEFEERAPHCKGDFTTPLLWFGHASNIESLHRIWPELLGYRLRIVTNGWASMPGIVEWRHEDMPQHFANSSIVIIPATASYKSPNRAVEAIRQGCFVVAEKHPALRDIPGIWKGNIKEGIEWAIKNPQAANQRTLEAQAYVKERFSPRTQAFALNRVILASSCTWEAEK
jgi:uncharacterized Rossmann fold enzyme